MMSFRFWKVGKILIPFIFSLVNQGLQAQEQDGGELTLRTNQIGEYIAAVANDGRFFGIVCTRHGLGLAASTADLVFPDSRGDIGVENYGRMGDRRVVPVAKSPSKPLTSKAVSKICNEPNGVYTLRFVTQDKISMVDFVSGQTIKAEANSGGRFY